MSGGYDISASMSNAQTFAQQTGSGAWNVGGDKGLKQVLFAVLGVVALGLVLWFLKKKK